MFSTHLATLTGTPLSHAGIGDRSLSDIVNVILALLIAILVHELGHAIVADRLGDDTPRLTGHLSLNPFRHMDRFGILLLFLTAISGQGFTYGFTPVNERKLRERSQFGPAIVALAGPVMNILLALITALIIKHVVLTTDLYQNAQVDNFISIVFTINIFLAVFNLLPLPPLDGWTIFSAFLSPKARFETRTFVQYGPFILLILFFFEPQIHFFSSVIDPITGRVGEWLLKL